MRRHPHDCNGSCRYAIAAVEDPAPRPCAPPGSHSTSPAPFQHLLRVCGAHNVQSFGNGWRVAGLIAPNHPSPAKTGFCPVAIARRRIREAAWDSTAGC